MRTPTSDPLLYASPPSTRKHAFKRRKLSHSIDPPPSRALTDNSNVPSAPSTPFLSSYVKLSCSTCHRTLSAPIRPGVAGPSTCSKCAAPTCAICARTCTSYTRPMSFPPTPALTRSPSPSIYAVPPVSPKRATLSLSYASMNCDSSISLSLPSIPSAKRKKAPADKDADADLDSARCDNHGVTVISTPGLWDGIEPESVIISGCGRVVCRTCCVESVLNDGKLCVDCFALV